MVEYVQAKEVFLKVGNSCFWEEEVREEGEEQIIIALFRLQHTYVCTTRGINEGA